MKIAFDAKRITHNATGLGNYSRFVVNSLSSSFPEHIYQLYTPGKGKEIAYLLQRIEDFPGTVVLATNLKSNIDEAFSRRFQSIIYFPMPDQDLREELWRRMLPSSWLPADADKMIRMAATYELSGGSISNVIRRCALRLLKQDTPRLDSDILSMAIRRELNKEGRW